MLRPSFRQRQAFWLGRRVAPEHHEWAETQLRGLRPLRVNFYFLPVLYSFCAVSIATSNFDRSDLFVPMTLTLSTVLTTLYRCSPRGQVAVRHRAGLPVQMPTRAGLADLSPYPAGFTTPAVLVGIASYLVLAVGTNQVLAASFDQDRCRSVSAADLRALQDLLVAPIDPGLLRIPRFADGAVNDKHPRLVAARQVRDGGPLAIHFVAAYVEVDDEGARQLRGPAVWRVFDSADLDVELPAGFPRGPQLTSADLLAHRLTPTVGYLSDYPLDRLAKKARDCARDAR